MLVSSSEGFWREGEFAAILLSEGDDILAAGDDVTSVGGIEQSSMSAWWLGIEVG